MSGRRSVVTGGVYIPDTGNLPERAEQDTYLTPPEETRLCYEFLLKREPQLREWQSGLYGEQRLRILDIGAGPGIWGQVAREIWPDCVIHGVEVRELPQPAAYDFWIRDDVREWRSRNPVRYPYDLVVGNPPYYIDEECVQIGLKSLRPGGFLMMLLPLTFLVGQKRRDMLYAQHPLTYFGAFSKRISWTKDGKTPPRDHGIYLFKKGHVGPYEGYSLGKG